MTAAQSRQIFLHGPVGHRQFRETLGGQLVALAVVPDTLWLVSPWISDFPVLDNRSGGWNAIEPSWGCKEIAFHEVLARLANGGCSLRIVMREVPNNQRFYRNLHELLAPDADCQVQFQESVHTKGLLCKSFFLRGSLNYTFSGTHINEEYAELTSNPDIIAEALIELQQQYTFSI